VSGAASDSPGLLITGIGILLYAALVSFMLARGETPEQARQREERRQRRLERKASEAVESPKICGTCHFAHRELLGDLRCRLNPPAIDRWRRSTFPKVGFFHWCGQWRPWK
jgi:hypothetical protein